MECARLTEAHGIDTTTAIRLEHSTYLNYHSGVIGTLRGKLRESFWRPVLEPYNSPGMIHDRYYLDLL